MSVACATIVTPGLEPGVRLFPMHNGWRIISAMTA